MINVDNILSRKSESKRPLVKLRSELDARTMPKPLLKV
jgi:hypothetical protein